MAHEYLRTWKREAWNKAGWYALSLYDTGKRDSMGKNVLAYVLSYQREVIFRGEDLHCSPLHAIDSDESAGALLAFLSLRPGDTDPEYFDTYTQAQLDFALGHGEELSLWAMELEGND